MVRKKNMYNEQEQKVIEQYTGYPEGKRLTYTKANETEFIITMHYLQKFLKPGAKIADIGAGGGTYTKALVTDNTGSSRILETIQTVDELIDAVCKENDAQKVCRFAQDGVSQIIGTYVNSMSKKSYEEWIQYLIATAERTDLMGYSDHIVQVIKK